MSIIKNIPLSLTTPSWIKEYEELMNDNFLQKKYNRDARLNSKVKYIKKYLPEILHGGKYVLDLGPGPGEFLEVCRYFKNKIHGIDARPGDSEMGDEYLKLSMLLSSRQSIPIEYTGFDTILYGKKMPFKDRELNIINSQGSIEQIYKAKMAGEPVRNHRISSNMTWIFDQDTFEKINHMFQEFYRVLDKNGIVLIYGNGASNVEEYNKNIISFSIKNKFKMEIIKDNRLHKMRKV